MNWELAATTRVSRPSRVLFAECSRAESGSELCGGLLDHGGERKSTSNFDPLELVVANN